MYCYHLKKETQLGEKYERRDPQCNYCGPVHTTPEKFENATITGHFGFVFEEDYGREIT